MNRYLQEFVQGLRESPLVFFAPIIAIWRLLDATTEQLLRASRARYRQATLARGPDADSAARRYARQFVQGLREGPLVFVAPLVACWRLVNATAEQLMRESRAKHSRHVRGVQNDTVLSQAGRAFVQGLREGPLVFFAPIIAIWRLINTTTEQLMRESEQRHRRAGQGRRCQIQILHYIDPGAVFVLVFGLGLCYLGLLYGRWPRPRDNHSPKPVRRRDSLYCGGRVLGPRYPCATHLSGEARFAGTPGRLVARGLFRCNLGGERRHAFPHRSRELLAAD